MEESRGKFPLSQVSLILHHHLLTIYVMLSIIPNMGKILYLDFTLDYKFNTPYNDILWKGELVRGFAISFTVTITNRSEYVFPGTAIRTSINDHRSSAGAVPALTWPRFLVPRLNPDTHFTSPEYTYTPQYEGVCEIILDSEAFKRREINISGSMQKTPVPTRISSRFFVIRWQELEIIQLLRKLEAKGA